MPRQRHASARRARMGFTLIELLMVVLIISILVAILMPVIVSVMRQGLVAKSQARLSNLSTGVVTYYKDQHFYPGQSGWGKTQLDTKALTGSQLLAQALFADIDGTGYPKSNYAQYQPSETTLTISGKAETIGDCWPKGQTLALCYYPARMGETGVGQFHEADNDVYTNANKLGVFSTVITHPAMANTPVKAGQFILIGPSQNRKYFDADDVTNYGQ